MGRAPQSDRTSPAASRPAGVVRPLRAVRWWLVALLWVAACTDVTPGPPTIAAFTTDRSATNPGSAVTLSWQVSGAETLRLLPDDVDVTAVAAIEVEPLATTSYVLVAENALGSASRMVQVRVGDLPEIHAFAADPPAVNPGLSTTLTWTVNRADAVWLASDSEPDVEVTGLNTFFAQDLPPGARIVLRAINEYGETEADIEVARTVPAFSVLVVGQSNAQGVNVGPLEAFAFITASDGVSMLGNDYVWKPAFEPLDDCTNQVDLISADPPGACTSLEGNFSGVSAGVSIGNHVAAATGGEALLIPAARGASSVKPGDSRSWSPAADRYARNTLFGSATYRGTLAGLDRGAPLDYRLHGNAYGAIFWYQGESDTDDLGETEDFQEYTPAVLGAFRQELGAPTIVAQLSRRGKVDNRDEVARNLMYQIARESQRLLAAGSRTVNGDASTASLPETYLVVTHDLPMAEGRHLSAAGQVELGRRVALAIRQHLLGEDVDGTGPRLVRVDKASTTAVRVHTDRAISVPAAETDQAYSGYFAVFSGSERIPVSKIERHPGDDRVVLITLAQSVAGGVEVRYMPPPGTLTQIAPDVIRSATCSEPIPIPGPSLCLPMPAFGVATDALTTAALQLFHDSDDDDVR